jgi:NADH:ubiquinone oxidoreductase subunit 4 (subunit M)
MYWQSTTNLTKIPVNGLSRLAISGLIIATIWLGIYPQPIFDALKR